VARRGRLRILLSGRIAGALDQGGLAWVVLQYALGLRRLGHEVLLVESLPAAALGPPLAESRAGRYFRAVASRFGLEDATLVGAGTRETAGLSYERLAERARSADLLVNISGLLREEALLERIPIRVYLDVDPGFTQLWHLGGIDMSFSLHTHFATIGEGLVDSNVPTCGLSWLTTRQPVVLERWPVAEELVWDGLTTIAHWRSYGSIEHEGVHYGQKAHSLRPMLPLPTRTDERFLLALSIDPGDARDLEALRVAGWQLLDPIEAAGTPERYHAFVQGSKAEFAVAKSGYVQFDCGWFGDRSVCYLASGRPVFAQETGFSRFLPTGRGLVAFHDADGVLAAVDELRRDYRGHRQAARALAEEYFDSDRVLTRLLESVAA
jgi:hypothetical protein